MRSLRFFGFCRSYTMRDCLKMCFQYDCGILGQREGSMDLFPVSHCLVIKCLNRVHIRLVHRACHRYSLLWWSDSLHGCQQEPHNRWDPVKPHSGVQLRFYNAWDYRTLHIPLLHQMHLWRPIWVSMNYQSPRGGWGLCGGYFIWSSQVNTVSSGWQGSQRRHYILSVQGKSVSSDF